ncbi:hypothetical protein AVEN_132381-1 [Araneus ventricosus]|uniref:Uncharacterized protein n=1 Tax=Araneus ventricosus TaxID=182803 RepID=A0A4Y2RU94_ARAVE|nr:hypothetical protein AVEN_132381-1 [Araneus ventricosus]
MQALKVEKCINNQNSSNKTKFAMHSWLILMLVVLACASMVLADDSEALCLMIPSSTMNMMSTVMNGAMSMYQKYRG